MVKAYASHQPKGGLTPFDYELPDIKSDEVDIAVKYCGICHSDMDMVNNDWGITEYPIVPGHEVVGVVSQVGCDVQGLEEGQWVGLGWHAYFCNHCHYCNVGDHNLCSEAQGTIVSHHGGFADTVRAQATSVVPIPDGMDYAVIPPLFCAGITVYNPMVQFDIKPTEKVGVVGIGGLGHIALQFLHAWGCEVTAFTTSDDKKQEALKMGAHHTLNTRSETDFEKAAGSFDYILITTNASLDWNAYLNLLAPKGRLHFVGVVPTPLDLSLQPILFKQLSVSSSPVGSPATIKRMLEFAHQHNIKPMVETYPFSEVNQAMDKMASGDVRYRIVLSHEAL
ncbi:MAG: NAD(P)-dependent alcohol dehydrogenase [Cellvibrionales bacterium]|nr:NAD(P)-dependent alcohol dehydrogenase [Cellvibrionales bacterium]